jgi:hypothetical protein
MTVTHFSSMEPKGLCQLYKNPELGPICSQFNPLNAKLNPICPLQALLGAHPILHVSRIRINVIQVLAVCCFDISITCISNGLVPSAGLYFGNQSTGIFDRVVKKPATYTTYAYPIFKSLPETGFFSVEFLVVLSSHVSRIPGCYLKLGLIDFLVTIFQFSVH